MPKPTPDEMPQRTLALELRYAIDQCQRLPSDVNYGRIARLIAGNPKNVRSRHVQHNLGVERLRWLKERPRLGLS